MSFNIPYSRMTLNGGSSLPVAYWRKYDTESTSERSTSRLILTPASTISGIKSWEWWFIGSMKVPVGSPTTARTFTTFNVHNTALDVGGGIGWNYGDQVSAFQLLVRPNGSQYNIWLNHSPNSPNNEFLLASNVTPGTLYTFTVQLIWGRLDQQIGLAGPGVSGGGVAGHPNNGYGRTRVWVNASDTPIDTGNINTLQRAVNPSDGKTYTQTAAEGPWDGYYGYGGSSFPTTYSLEVTATRVGRSFGEAKLDGTNGFSLLEEGVFAGSASVTTLTSLVDTDIALPPSLTGGSSPPPTPTSHFGRWTDSVQWNAGVIAGEPETPPTVNEQHLGRWSSYVEWNAAGAANILIAP